MTTTRRTPVVPLVIAVALAGLLAAGLGAGLLAALSGVTPAGCAGAGVAGPASIALGPGAGGELVGASEYGGPGDPSSGVVGASGVDLLSEPDSYAELGGFSFATATAMGGLPYGTPLRISWDGRSAIARKEDIGLGGGPIDGLPRVIDLWWQLAVRLGIPYEGGEWSGPVRVERPPATGAGNVLGVSPAAYVSGDPIGVSTGVSIGVSTGGVSAECSGAAGSGVPATSGPRAALLPDGLAAAPVGAPAVVRAMIAAGNAIVGKPYVYGAGHGLPLSEIAAAYDCSSSVEHILYGGGLLPVDYSAASGALESFGAPGPGRWVTIYASADHVFMYVAGLRWDTHNAAGPDDGAAGLGWHPLVREDAGFVVRHPVGL